METIFFDDTGHWWQIPIQTVLGFTTLILLLRLAGKRTVASFNMYDMVLTFSIGSIISSMIILENVKFFDAAIALISIVLMDYVISQLAYASQFFRRMIKAQPTLLVFNGEMQRSNMRKERIVEDEIVMFMRQNSIDKLSDVKAMVLESTGSVSVFTDEGESHDMTKSLERSGVSIPEDLSDEQAANEADKKDGQEADADQGGTRHEADSGDKGKTEKSVKAGSTET